MDASSTTAQAPGRQQRRPARATRSCSTWACRTSARRFPRGARSIDFLFAISASGTMQPRQQEVELPGSISAIEEQLADFDFIFISASAGSTWPLKDCALARARVVMPRPRLQAAAPSSTSATKSSWAQASHSRLARARRVRRCGLHGGNRYIVDGEPDLTEAFTCIAQVGVHGGSLTAEAMVNALSPEMNAPLACRRASCAMMRS